MSKSTPGNKKIIINPKEGTYPPPGVPIIDPNERNDDDNDDNDDNDD